MNRYTIAMFAIALLALGAAAYYFDTGEANAPVADPTVTLEAELPGKVVYRAGGNTSVPALREDCAARGGRFDPCGSPCAPDAEVCATVCVPVCVLATAPPVADFGVPPPFTAETTRLAAVGASTGEGIATRDWDGTAFVHTLTAKLPTPPAGSFYEGWLVKPGRTPAFFSTGKLEASGGGFALTFTAAEDRRDHPQAVVTLETLTAGLDGTPETHVLEGTFGTP